MTFARWTGSAWQTFTTYRRWTGSAWQAIANARRWNGTSWVIFGFLQATLSPTVVNGSRNTAGVASTNACTTTPTNGSGSYTYLWIITQVDGNTVSALNPTSASTVFQALVNSTTPNSDATAVCQVTDTVTGLVVTTSNNVTIGLSYTGP